jgi:transcription termination factor NusB
VELAKRFGSEDSPAFVNGILDRIMTEIRKTQALGGK